MNEEQKALIEKNRLAALQRKAEKEKQRSLSQSPIAPPASHAPQPSPPTPATQSTRSSPASQANQSPNLTTSSPQQKLDFSHFMFKQSQASQPDKSQPTSPTLFQQSSQFGSSPKSNVRSPHLGAHDMDETSSAPITLVRVEESKTNLSSSTSPSTTKAQTPIVIRRQFGSHATPSQSPTTPSLSMPPPPPPPPPPIHPFFSLHSTSSTQNSTQSQSISTPDVGGGSQSSTPIRPYKQFGGSSSSTPLSQTPTPTRKFNTPPTNLPPLNSPSSVMGSSPFSFTTSKQPTSARMFSPANEKAPAATKTQWKARRQAAKESFDYSGWDTDALCQKMSAPGETGESKKAIVAELSSRADPSSLPFLIESHDRELRPQIRWPLFAAIKQFEGKEESADEFLRKENELKLAAAAAHAASQAAAAATGGTQFPSWGGGGEGSSLGDSQMMTTQQQPAVGTKRSQSRTRKSRSSGGGSGSSGTDPAAKRRRRPRSDFFRQMGETDLMEPDFDSLSDEQKFVYLKIVEEGKNVFYTGSAGTGKSFLTREVVKGLRKKHGPAAVFVTASTGIAACNISGSTLHSYAGTGIGKEEADVLFKQMSKVNKARWMETKALIVDEISMIDGIYFEKIEQIGRWVRRNERPFGGIQVILCGDFLQLPPVKVIKQCFEASCWDKVIDLSVELRQVFRQSDGEFVKLLNEVRTGKVSSETKLRLEYCKRPLPCADGIMPTTLFPKLDKVAQKNSEELTKLAGDSMVYEAADSGQKAYVDKLDDNCNAPKRLELRVDSQVMLLKNINVMKGLVNGARGVVVGFSEDEEKIPIVKFACGATTEVMREEWKTEVGNKVVATRRQIPLMLAWAISIHKAQGMTIEKVVMDLSCFESGQAYVALSRAVNLEGLQVKALDTSKIFANPKAIRFYEKLKHLTPKDIPHEYSSLSAWAEVHGQKIATGAGSSATNSEEQTAMALETTASMDLNIEDDDVESVESFEEAGDEDVIEIVEEEK